MCVCVFVWSPESFITRAKENFHMKVNFEFLLEMVNAQILEEE